MLTLPFGRISSRALGALVAAVRKTPARVPLTRLFRAQLGIDALPGLGPEARAPLPFSHAPLVARENHERTSLGLDSPPSRGWPPQIMSFASEYRNGAVSSVHVVTRAPAHARSLSARSPTLGPLCGYDDESALRAAEESARRFAEGNVLQVLAHLERIGVARVRRPAAGVALGLLD